MVARASRETAQVPGRGGSSTGVPIIAKRRRPYLGK
jgi:hypothetical protein